MRALVTGHRKEWPGDAIWRGSRADIALRGDFQRLDRHDQDGDSADKKHESRGQEQHRMPARRGCADARVRAHSVCSNRAGHGRGRQRWPLTDACAAADSGKSSAALRGRQPGLEVDNGAFAVGRRCHM